MGALNGHEYVRASGFARGSRYGYDDRDSYGEYHDRGWWSWYLSEQSEHDQRGNVPFHVCGCVDHGRSEKRVIYHGRSDCGRCANHAN